MSASQCEHCDEVLNPYKNEDVRALKDALENLNTKDHIKNDSDRYFVEKF